MHNARTHLVILAGLIAAYVIMNVGLVFWLGHEYRPSLFISVWSEILKDGLHGRNTAVPKSLAFLTMLAVGIPAIFILASLGWISTENRYGNAHFANAQEVKKMKLFSKQGIILGFAFGWFNTLIGARILRTCEPLSILLLAPPGTGKTAGIVVPNLLSCGDSMIAHDVKGELYAMTSKRRAEFSKVIRFSPADESSACWNPLCEKSLPGNWDDKVAAVERIGSTIYQSDAKSGDDYWTSEARVIFIFFALDLIHRHGFTSLPDIRAAGLAEGDIQGWMAEYVDENEASLPDRVIQEANGLIAKADKEFSGCFGTFKKGLNVFGDARVARASSRSDFSLLGLRSEPTTVYVTVRPNDSERLAPYLRLLFEQAASTLLSVQKKPGEVDITFMLDEFIRLGRIPTVIESPALSRGYGVRSILVAQDYGQIRKLYGDDGVEEIKSTTAYKVILTQNNDKTCEDVSRSIGDRTEIKKTRSSSRGGGSTSYAEEKLPLVKPQDVGELKFGHALVTMQGYKATPIRARLPFYFKVKAFKRLVGCVDPNFEQEVFEAAEPDEHSGGEGAIESQREGVAV